MAGAGRGCLLTTLSGMDMGMVVEEVNVSEITAFKTFKRFPFEHLLILYVICNSYVDKYILLVKKMLHYYFTSQFKFCRYCHDGRSRQFAKSQLSTVLPGDFFIYPPPFPLFIR
jgi:hypothetical protein